MKYLTFPPLLAATIITFSSGAAMASQEMAQKAMCTACHAVDKKVVGPSYKDVAAKYKGQAGAQAALIDKVRKGSTGAWGTIPMPPTGPDKINDADLKTVIDWVLKS